MDFRKKGKEACRAIVIQFSHEFTDQLCQFCELKSIEKLLAKCNRGLQFTLTKNNDLLPLLNNLVTGNEFIGFTLLLQALHQLTLIKSKPIASVQCRPMKGDENQQRINQVLLYVQKEFKANISLKHAASLIHLSESAFCKFFKRASGKTFSDYTNEIRIAHACRLLIETDAPIAKIAYDSGFESLTYFNRVFLKKKKVKPSIFRQIETLVHYD